MTLPVTYADLPWLVTYLLLAQDLVLAWTQLMLGLNSKQGILKLMLILCEKPSSSLNTASKQDRKKKKEKRVEQVQCFSSFNSRIFL